MVTALPRKVRHVATVALSRHRVPTQSRFHVGVVTVTAPALLLIRAMQEGLHAVEEQATDEVSSPKLQTHPGRMAKVTTPVHTGPTAVRHPLLDPGPAAPISINQLSLTVTRPGERPRWRPSLEDPMASRARTSGHTALGKTSAVSHAGPTSGALPATATGEGSLDLGSQAGHGSTAPIPVPNGRRPA